MDTQTYIQKLTQQKKLTQEDTQQIYKARSYLQEKNNTKEKPWFFKRLFQAKYKTANVIESLKVSFPEWNFYEETILDESINKEWFAKIKWSKVEYNGYNISYKEKYKFSTSFVKSSSKTRNSRIINQNDMFIKIELPQSITTKSKFVIIKNDFRDNTITKIAYSLIAPAFMLIFTVKGEDDDTNIYQDHIFPTIEKRGINEHLLIWWLALITGGISYAIINRYKGRQAINLENRQFEKHFDVDSNDPIIARQVCNSYVMEQITNRNKITKTKKKPEFLITDNILCIKYNMMYSSIMQKFDNISSDKQAIQTLIYIYTILKDTKKLCESIGIENILRVTKPTTTKDSS